MTRISDLAVSAGINIAVAFAFLLAFALLKLQPVNERVYYPKWFIKGVRQDRKPLRRSLSSIVNLD
eukprot:c50788_g1_i1 orf=2-196(-)